jgi:hypothetical protein
LFTGCDFKKRFGGREFTGFAQQVTDQFEHVIPVELQRFEGFLTSQLNLDLRVNCLHQIVHWLDFCGQVKLASGP